MAEIIGRRTSLGVARETTRGTGVAPTYWMPRTELSFDDRVERVVSGEAMGHIDDSSDAFVTAKYADGSINAEVRDDSFGLFLYALLGSCSSAALGGGDYRHTFTESNSNQHQSLTLTTDSANGDKMFELSMLNNLEIAAEVGQIVNFSSDFVSKNSMTTTQSATTCNAENRFVSHHCVVKLATDYSGLDAASAIPVKRFNLSFAKNIMRDHELGTISPTEIHNQQFGVEGSFELNFEDFTYHGYMMDNTYRAIRFEATNTDVTLGGGNNPKLTIDLSRASFYDWERDNTLDDLSLQTINFKGHRDCTNSKNIVNQIQLTNEVSSY